jgi:hypothetical protein
MQLEVSAQLLETRVTNEESGPGEQICESTTQTASPALVLVRSIRRQVVVSRKLAFELWRMKCLLVAFFQQEENHHKAMNRTTWVGDT